MSQRVSRSARRQPQKDRTAAVMPLAAILAVPLIGCLAFAVDMGYITLVRTQLQAAADAGALAGVGAMLPDPPTLEAMTYFGPDDTAARTSAQQFVQSNVGGGRSLTVDLNAANAIAGDIVLGRLNNPSDPADTLDASSGSPNSVQVRIPLSASHANGALSLFFAPVLGIGEIDASATATATVEFPTLLPFATSLPKWDSLATGGDGDIYNYNNGDVLLGADGIPEISIFPENGGGWNDSQGLPPGNFGMVQIGPQQGTGVLRRQIDQGPSAVDMNYHGGSLAAGVEMVGQTGVNGDIKTAFNGGSADGTTYYGILGEIRYLPIYSSVTGNGHNARFTIVKFVSVRVMYVKMTGNPKTIVLQPVTSDSELIRLRLSR